MISLTTKERKWALLFLLPFYFFYGQFLFSFLFIALAWIFGFNISKASIDAYFNLIYLVFLAFVSLYIFKPYLTKSLQAMKGRWMKQLLYACTIGTVKFYVFNIVSSLLILLLVPNSSSANQDAIAGMTTTAPMVMAITTVVLAPFVEEMIFRVGLFQLFYTKNRKLAYLVSSLAFGFVHIVAGLSSGDLSQIFYLLPYGLLGYVLCDIYESRQSIFVPMIVHSMNNLIAMLVLL